MVDMAALNPGDLVDVTLNIGRGRTMRTVQRRAVVKRIDGLFATVVFCSPDTCSAKLRGKWRELACTQMELVAPGSLQSARTLNSRYKES